MNYIQPSNLIAAEKIAEKTKSVRPRILQENLITIQRQINLAADKGMWDVIIETLPFSFYKEVKELLTNKGYLVSNLDKNNFFAIGWKPKEQPPPQT